jgi:hypothetical protein
MAHGWHVYVRVAGTTSVYYHGIGPVCIASAGPSLSIAVPSPIDTLSVHSYDVEVLTGLCYVAYNRVSGSLPGALHGIFLPRKGNPWLR